MKPIYITLIICVFFLILTIIIVIKNIKRKIRCLKSKIISPVTLVHTAKQMCDKIENNQPEIKSIGGATSTLLPQIEKDFPDFHNPDAQEVIKTFLIEYINIKYGVQQGFIKSKVDKHIDYNIHKTKIANVSNITFNRISIYNYKKTNDYATITYKASLGYDCDGDRIESRYELDYTLQLKDDEINMKALICDNCGGSLSTLDTICPYCDVKIIKDTIMNWIVMRINEI